MYMVQIHENIFLQHFLKYFQNLKFVKKITFFIHTIIVFNFTYKHKLQKNYWRIGKFLSNF